MIPYRFSYLLTDAVFFFLWVALYLWRKDIRKEMVVISALFGFIAIAGESFMVNDWWSPQTITNTTIGIEDFLFGFTVGGIASVVYEEVFQKKLRKKTRHQRKGKYHLCAPWLLPIVFSLGFFIFNLNTFIATMAGLVSSVGLMLFLRKDLLIDAICSGALLLITAFFAYTLVEFLTPGWVRAFWEFKNMPEFVWWNVPIEDIIWYPLAGAYGGILYEYWKELAPV